MKAWAVATATLLAAAGSAFGADPFLRHTPTVDAVKRVGPAVVNITTEQIVAGGGAFRPFNDPFFDRFFQDFFEPRAPQTLKSLGSGVLIDAERHVLTNEHVISRASRIRVSLSDGREFDARLVGADPNNDLAVLRVESKEALPWIPPSTSSDLMVGEPVIAIGNPFGLSNTVTTGVISAADRSIRTEDRVYHGFIQTDASINPGNSGGPLLNAEGSLIGINTAIYGGGAQGIGFAIPIDVAKRVVGQLIAHGEVAPTSLGFEVQDLDPRMIEVMEIPHNVTGALVSNVRPGGPGARAGVARGEVVTRLAGQSVKTARDFYEVLGSLTEGEPVQIRLWRDRSERTVQVTAEALAAGEVDALAERLLGLRLRPRAGGGFTVASVRPGTGAAQIGFQPGDLVLGINGLELGDASSFRRAVLDLRGRGVALVVVQRGADRYHVSVPLS
jgi:Do/DeqQ family serine protease